MERIKSQSRNNSSISKEHKETRLVGVLHATPVCGGFQLLADSRQKSQLLHTAQRGRSLNSSNAIISHLSGGRGCCVSTL